MPARVHHTAAGPAIGLRVQFYATLADAATAIADAAWLADTDHLLVDGHDGAGTWTLAALTTAEDLAANVTRRVALDRLRFRFEHYGYTASNDNERAAMFADFPAQVANAKAAALFPELVPARPVDAVTYA